MKKQLVALIAIFTINQVNATCFDIFNNTDQNINAILTYAALPHETKGNDNVHNTGIIASRNSYDQCLRKNEGRASRTLNQLTLTLDGKKEDIIFSDLVGTKGTKGKSGLMGDGALTIYKDTTLNEYCIYVTPSFFSPYSAFTLYKGPKADTQKFKIDEHNYCQKFTLGCKTGTKCSTDSNKKFQDYRNQITTAAARVEKQLFDWIDAHGLSDASAANQEAQTYINSAALNIDNEKIRTKFIALYKKAYENAILIAQDTKGTKDTIKQKIHDKVLWYMENIQDQVDVFDQACIEITGDKNSTPCFPQ